jgi:hypothetical protein
VKVIKKSIVFCHFRNNTVLILYSGFLMKGSTKSVLRPSLCKIHCYVVHHLLFLSSLPFCDLPYLPSSLFFLKIPPPLCSHFHPFFISIQLHFLSRSLDSGRLSRIGHWTLFRSYLRSIETQIYVCRVYVLI